VGGRGGRGAGLAAPAPGRPDFQPPTLALPASAPLRSPGPCLPRGLCCCLPRVSSWLRVTPDTPLIIGGQRGGEQQKYSMFTSPPHPELLSALHRGIARKLYNRSLPIDHPLPPKTTPPKKGEEVSRNPGGWPWTLARWKPWSCPWPVKPSSLGWLAQGGSSGQAFLQRTNSGPGDLTPGPRWEVSRLPYTQGRILRPCAWPLYPLEDFWTSLLHLQRRLGWSYQPKQQVRAGNSPLLRAAAQEYALAPGTPTRLHPPHISADRCVGFPTRCLQLGPRWGLQRR